MGEKKLIDKFKTLESTPPEEVPPLKIIDGVEPPASKKPKELERLILVLKDSETKTINLIKDIVQSRSKEDELLLKLILHSLENVYLKKISHFLSQEEKVFLFNSNYQLPNEEETKNATALLEAKLNQLNLIDTKLANQDALNKLLSLSVEEVREFVELNPQIGSKALSLFQPDKVAKILEGYPDDVLSSILEKVEEFKGQEEIKELEKSILAFKSRRYANSSFIKKLPLIIAELDIDKENFIIDQMKFSDLDKAQIEVIVEAKPIKLISQLSEEFFSKVGEGIALEQKVKIVLSSSQSFITNIQNGFFPNGTQIYEMYKMEESNIRANKVLYKTLKRNESVIWRDFAKVCRDTITNSETYLEEFRSIVHEWASS